MIKLGPVTEEQDEIDEPIAKKGDQNIVIDENDDEELVAPEDIEEIPLKLNNPKEQYETIFAELVKTAIVRILNNPEYIEMTHVQDPLENLTKKENLIEAIKGLEVIYPVLGFAQMIELGDFITNLKFRCPKDLKYNEKERYKHLSEVLPDYKIIKANAEDEKILIRKILEDPTLGDDNEIKNLILQDKTLEKNDDKEKLAQGRLIKHKYCLCKSK